MFISNRLIAELRNDSGGCVCPIQRLRETNKDFKLLHCFFFRYLYNLRVFDVCSYFGTGSCKVWIFYYEPFYMGLLTKLRSSLDLLISLTGFAVDMLT